MKHGLTAEVLRTPEEDAALVAGKPMATWLETEMALVTMRINRVHQSEERERTRASERSESCWDDDRRSEAARMGEGLARHPDRVVPRLKTSTQGCVWLIERWEWLRDLAGQEGGWDAEHKAHASDLLGIPAWLRRDHDTDSAAQVALATAQIKTLQAARDARKKSDTFDRETTRLGLDNEASPELRRLIRYEAALHRRLRWCFDRVHPPTTRRTPDLASPEASLRPRPTAKPEPRVDTPKPAAVATPQPRTDREPLRMGYLPPLSDFLLIPPTREFVLPHTIGRSPG